MRRIYLGILLVSLSALVVELMLTRAFDVIIAENFSYFIVSVAICGFGLAGVYAALRPIAPGSGVERRLARASAGLAGVLLVLVPLINHLDLDYARVFERPVLVVGSYLVLFLALLTPFFLAGYILVAVFSAYARRIQRLYFWDLAGAGIGTVLVVPLVLRIGPGGLILCAAALALLASAVWSTSRSWQGAAAIGALVIAAVPAMRGQHYVDFTYHMDKRGILTAIAEGRHELTRWDPVSKIDVIDETLTPETKTRWHRIGDRKSIEYDGGNQSSYFYRFNGDYAGLRRLLDRDLSTVSAHFWQLGVLAAEWLKRDSRQSVLVIGSAGGQETKAALVYGASHVDAVELVPTVVRLGLGRYSAYIGNLFHDPAVSVHADEGRSFLRDSHRRYDIIQIYSNYTSSSIAEGNGAYAPEYLETAEAYEEYFSHLTANGVLQVNQYAYPRLVTTAALAWRRLGRTDFESHIAVFTCPNQPTLPTILIKMTPWTAAEIAALQRFLSPPELRPRDRLTLVENPVDARQHFLSPAFFSGDFPRSLAARMRVNATPRTDDDPYYGALRTSVTNFAPVVAGRDLFVDRDTAFVFNRTTSHGLPMDLMPLTLLALASILFGVLFVVAPLRFSSVGRIEGAHAAPLLVYFSCLGAGFISIELVLIQKYMQVIGSPLYTYSTVIFTLLLAAGLGSAASERLGIGMRERWPIPFIAIIVLGAALLALYPAFAHVALAFSTPLRVVFSALTILPLGFFLGMPFPIGVLALERHPPGAIAWAWGMNGLMTVAGGLVSVVLSVVYGFAVAIGVALALYAVAALVFVPMREFAARRVPGALPAALAAGDPARSLSMQRDATG